MKTKVRVAWLVALNCILAANVLMAQSLTLTATYTNPAPVADDHFAANVAGVGDNRVLIGAPSVDVGALNSGVAYLFDLAGNRITTCTNPTPVASDFFGRNVAAVGTNRVLVGAYMDNTGAADSGAAYLFGLAGNLITTYTNPTPAGSDYFSQAMAGVGTNRVVISAADRAGSFQGGAAYVFDLAGNLLTTITNPTPMDYEDFAWSLAAVGDNRVLIGCYGESTAADWAGAAYLYDLAGNLLTTYTNPTPVMDDEFGRAVAAVGTNYVLIGANGDDTGATDAGAAYLYDLAGNLITTYTNPAPAASDYFGRAVAGIGGDRVLIGAYGDDTGAANAGTAYVFDLAGHLLTTITNPAPAPGDYFSYVVAAVGANRVLIGADPDDAGASNAGAAYLFTLGDIAPAAPRLSITLNPQLSTMTVSWPSPADGWVLERTNALGSASVPWPQVAPPYQTNAGLISVTFTNAPPLGNHFFRLHKP